LYGARPPLLTRPGKQFGYLRSGALAIPHRSPKPTQCPPRPAATHAPSHRTHSISVAPPRAARVTHPSARALLGKLGKLGKLGLLGLLGLLGTVLRIDSTSLGAAES